MLYTGSKKAITTETDTDIISILEDAMDAHTSGNGGPSSDCDFVEFQDAASPPLAPDGISAYFMVTLGSGESETWLYLHDSETGDVESAVKVVPEPMTIALLGLGGLFLRRRK
jgi:hypothetical protein